MKKLAIITTHPVQYYAPVFQLLHQHQKISIKVFYTWGEGALKKYDPGFEKMVDWDIPLLDAYPYQWVKNIAKNPGSHQFKGIINPDLIAQIESWQADSVLVFGWAYQSHFKAIRYFKNKIPVYFRGDSTLLDEKKGVKSFFKTIFLKWLYGHVDQAFYVGTNNKAYFKKYGFKDKQLSFAPHAIDNERFGIERSTEARQLREGLGIDKNDIVVLFAGKLEEKKSPMLLLNTFLAVNNPNIHLLFVGNGELEESLKSKAGTNNNIHFIGFQNQSFMPVIYQACNLFCLPSKGPGESWGLAVNEAMACGKAVLVADKCGCGIDLVKKNGLIFQHDNPGDFKRALEKLVSNKHILDEYGNESRILITNFTFMHVANAIEKAFE